MSIHIYSKLARLWDSQRLLIFMLLLGAVNFACVEQKSPQLNVIRIGILPDQSAEELYHRYNPLFKYLSNELGAPFELTIPQDYDELLKYFVEDKLDLAYFGGVTFLKAHHRANALPLVMRDVDTRFSTSFIVKADNSAKDLAVLKGKTLAFGSLLSTSGHFMPRYFLQRQGISEPETYFSAVKYSGAHDTTAYWVRDGVVDVGVINSVILAQMLEDGRLKQGEIRVLLTTPTYTDYVWALNPSASDEIQIKIRDAFLKLSFENKNHKKILNSIGAYSFLPASMEDFTLLENILRDSHDIVSGE
jgi:phosphonate transport system substrate-binding protein